MIGALNLATGSSTSSIGPACDAITDFFNGANAGSGYTFLFGVLHPSAPSITDFHIMSLDCSAGKLVLGMRVRSTPSANTVTCILNQTSGGAERSSSPSLPGGTDIADWAEAQAAGKEMVAGLQSSGAGGTLRSYIGYYDDTLGAAVSGSGNPAGVLGLNKPTATAIRFGHGNGNDATYDTNASLHIRWGVLISQALSQAEMDDFVEAVEANPSQALLDYDGSVVWAMGMVAGGGTLDTANEASIGTSFSSYDGLRDNFENDAVNLISTAPTVIPVYSEFPINVEVDQGGWGVFCITCDRAFADRGRVFVYELQRNVGGAGWVSVSNMTGAPNSRYYNQDSGNPQGETFFDLNEGEAIDPAGGESVQWRLRAHRYNDSTDALIESTGWREVTLGSTASFTIPDWGPDATTFTSEASATTRVAMAHVEGSTIPSSWSTESGAGAQIQAMIDKFGPAYKYVWLRAFGDILQTGLGNLDTEYPIGMRPSFSDSLAGDWFDGVGFICPALAFYLDTTESMDIASLVTTARALAAQCDSRGGLYFYGATEPSICGSSSYVATGPYSWYALCRATGAGFMADSLGVDEFASRVTGVKNNSKWLAEAIDAAPDMDWFGGEPMISTEPNDVTAEIDNYRFSYNYSSKAGGVRSMGHVVGNGGWASDGSDTGNMPTDRRSYMWIDYDGKWNASLFEAVPGVDAADQTVIDDYALNPENYPDSGATRAQITAIAARSMHENYGNHVGIMLAGSVPLLAMTNDDVTKLGEYAIPPEIVVEDESTGFRYRSRFTGRSRLRAELAGDG